MQIKTSASLMCADFRNLLQDVRKLERAGIDWLHFDIMDDHFVPNLTIGPLIVESLRGKTDLPFDIHLQMTNPELFIPVFSRMGCEIITFHVEATSHLFRMVSLIKKEGKKAGLAINPATPENHLKYIISEIDLIIVMTVDPGFAGQRFIPQVIPKIEELRDMVEKKNLKIDIAVDGNIKEETIRKTKKAGANVFIGGTSAIFRPDRELEEAAREFKRICQEA
ncbi:MAG TPA: ribulose-phosphate 3-epimerase [Candidatus Aerophobetes bacterium]|uniref:Ribulose-phosphate 3-epimerase n=1 Tax=Aerophobetes bacterium TaxID=2030807 RepID=A0A662DII1_UNCAE|nr:MAG: ribulose-phosphate 3-epimerase [Candidatus Aerophobetes bacterium]HDN85040.1 ribulose-phosphate 3-epimerase [Candidatus Aerophobetes bacterium]